MKKLILILLGTTFLFGNYEKNLNERMTSIDATYTEEASQANGRNTASAANEANKAWTKN